MTEGCRGDGGVLLDKDGREFMRDYAPKAKNNGNLASRDVVARGMMKRIRDGFGVKSPYGEYLWLDIKRLGKEHIEKKLSDIAFICRNFIGVDPVKDLIPVRPVQHYSMGGVRTNIFGEAYGLKGLFSAGETACWDLHGFNRLGGNSLLETIAAGYVVGSRVIDYVKNNDSAFRSSFIEQEIKKQEERIKKIVSARERGECGAEILSKLRNILSENVGIFRNSDSLYQALISLKVLSEKAELIAIKSGKQAANWELEMALRLPGMIKLGIAIASGALNRRESRGSHFREDYPKRDDENFLKRTLAYSAETGVVIKYEDAVITHSPPGD
ncbi:MAG: FAD-binding protein, partial [Patescibacteria group bacterium]